jgi:putative colanic acid biosynthesis acetyltransferase WcaF
MTTDLSVYDNSWYKPGSRIKRGLWYFVNISFFKTGLFPFYGFKRFLLRAFGAKIGRGVLVKPFVNIKYPWFLEIADHVWIGEHVWIDNLGKVSIGNNVCLSQGAFLLTGNHNYTKPGFDLAVKPITLEEGVWIGAKAIVCPGVVCSAHALLTVGSVATSNLSAYGIYSGNPAVKIKERVFEL